MTEVSPRFGTKRFREILWMAVRAKPLRAASAIYWLLTRRRVRGWSQLMIAASDAAYNYLRWTKSGEVRAFARFREANADRAPIELVPVILADRDSTDEHGAQSFRSLRAALGGEVRIYSTSMGVEKSHLVPQESCESLGELASYLLGRGHTGWLLPILAGDVISPATPDIAQRAAVAATGNTMIYWDEDTVSGQVRRDPWIKPDWDEFLFGELGGLAGSCAVSLSALQALETAVARGLTEREAIDRVLFRLAGDSRTPPAHVPLILTHRAPQNALRPNNSITNRPSIHLEDELPSVSVIVPTRDRADLLASCLKGLERIRYPGHLELIVVDNGSVDPAALAVLDQIKTDPRARVIPDPGPFNFSLLNNRAAAVARNEYLCFLNNDVEATDGDWLSHLVTHALRDGVGAVGAMLLYPSGRIQHAGVVVGLGGAAGHVQRGIEPSERRFWTWHALTREVSAVTAAVMVIRKSTFVDIGGFDSETFPVAFNDVDLCLRLRRAGYRNLYVASVRMIHRESESRGDDRAKKNAARYSRELCALQERWNTKEAVDPHFSTLFSKLVEPCVLQP